MNVAIVNDSKMAVEILRRIVTSLPDFTLAWVAFSGEEALELYAKAMPDIVLMDLIMPGIGGAETTRRMMSMAPCVILVVTATMAGNRDQVFEAMGHGALDAVNTPVMAQGHGIDGAEPLIQKLRTVARLAVKQLASKPKNAPDRTSRIIDTSTVPIVAIGASTGGPQALAEILSQLPSTLPAAVLVVQHVDEQFAPGLAAWLQHHASLPVALARQDEPFAPGAVWIANCKEHLTYSSGIAHYTPVPHRAVHTPSIDVLFASLALPHLAPRIGVLLTGMGCDGADGLLAMRNSGALTIAQDEVTSVVYGMPRAAAALNAAIDILPLQAIAPRIVNLLGPATQVAPIPQNTSRP
jgi:two-component system response regulator WspF